MIFSRDYQKPFWHGFFHALMVVIYVLFLSLILLQLDYLFGNGLSDIIKLAFYLFLVFLSLAVCGWLIFYEPLKKMLHHHFRAATVMLTSTIGWLFIFLTIFVIGFVVTLV
jgi:hypothetical protein